LNSTESLLVSSINLIHLLSIFLLVTSILCNCIIKNPQRRIIFDSKLQKQTRVSYSTKKLPCQTVLFSSSYFLRPLCYGSFLVLYETRVCFWSLESKIIRRCGFLMMQLQRIDVTKRNILKRWIRLILLTNKLSVEFNFVWETNYTNTTTTTTKFCFFNERPRMLTGKRWISSLDNTTNCCCLMVD
jgi:hypothetical protein